jgi:hypothetical protein
MTDPCPPEKRSPLEHEHGELTPERIERLKAEVMTLETPYGLWVTAEDYVALSAERDALRAENKRLVDLAQSLLDAVEKGTMCPTTGVYGMTTEEMLKSMNYHGVPVWPFAEAQRVLTQETDR